MKNKKYNKKARNTDMIFGWVTIGLSILVIPGMFFILGVVLGVTQDNISIFGELVVYGIFLGLFWGFIGLIALLRAERSRKYVKIFGAYPRLKVSEVLKGTGKSLKSVSSDLNVMKKRGYFTDMSFDLEYKEIVFAPDTEPLLQFGDESLTVYKENKGLPIWAIVSAAVTLLSFSWNMIIAVLMGVGAFFLARKFFPRPVYFVEIKRKSAKLKKPANTGNNDLDSTLSSIFDSKKEMLRLVQSIVSPKIRQPLKEILRVLDQIAECVTEYPEKVKTLRQFTSYYLPTTLNFLQTYEELEQKPVQGENINATLRKIEEITANMVSVFKQEYDDLFSDKAMDVSADVAVMQAIIKDNQNITNE